MAKQRKHYIVFPQRIGVKPRLITAVRAPQPSDAPMLQAALHLDCPVGFVEGPFDSREAAKARAILMSGIR